jgi:uncharacterized protein YoxC
MSKEVYLLTPEILDVILTLLVLSIFLFTILIRKKTQKKINDVQECIVSLQANQEKANSLIETAIGSLQKDFSKKIQVIISDMNDLTQRVALLFEKDEQIRQDMESKLNPIKKSLKDLDASVTTRYDFVLHTLKDSEREIKALSRSIEDFSADNRKMKEVIREHTIDFEL